MTVRDGGRIHGWWNQFHPVIQRTGMAYTRFSGMERSSDKNSDLRSRMQCEAGSGGVKGQDERQNTAPLTPPLTPTLFCALTTDNVVIHGMTADWARGSHPCAMRLRMIGAPGVSPFRFGGFSGEWVMGAEFGDDLGGSLAGAVRLVRREADGAHAGMSATAIALADLSEVHHLFGVGFGPRI